MTTQSPIRHTLVPGHSPTTIPSNNNSPSTYAIDDTTLIPQLNELHVNNTPSSSTQSTPPLKQISKSLSHEQLSRRRLSVIGDPTEQVRIDGRQISNDSTYTGGEPVSLDTLHDAVCDVKTQYSVYTHTKTGYIPFNTKKVNQDRACITHLKYNNISLYGVFDGHGVHGHLVSQYLVDNLPTAISTQFNHHNINENTDDTVIQHAMVTAFEETNKSLNESIDTSYSGSTAVVTLLLSNNKLVVANTGDSRAMIARHCKKSKLKPLELSVDHKPDVPTEKQRIQQRNGRVEPCYDNRGQPLGPDRVWLKSAPTPGLGMSRAFGDGVASSVGVICTPDIQYHTIDELDEFLLICSDGVTELLTSMDAINIVASCSDVGVAAELLVDESIKAWKQQEQVIDDVTCVLVFFK